MAFMIDAGWMEVLIGAVALVVSIVLYRLAKKRKSLSYEVLSESPLVSISEEIKGNLQVLYNGEPAENIHLLLVKFVNDGNVPIAAADFERPLKLQFKDGSNIISAEKAQVTPENLNPSININGQAITVEPVMLNAGDSFAVRILMSQYGGGFDVDARVLGIKSVEMPSRRDRKLMLRVAEYAVLPLTALTGGALIIMLLASLIEIKNFILPPPPNVKAITADRYVLREREYTRLDASVEPSITGAKYEWSAERGKVFNTPKEGVAEYFAPDAAGPDTVTLKVTDKEGRTGTKSFPIQILPAEPAPTP